MTPFEGEGCTNWFEGPLTLAASMKLPISAAGQHGQWPRAVSGLSHPKDTGSMPAEARTFCAEIPTTSLSYRCAVQHKP